MTANTGFRRASTTDRRLGALAAAVDALCTLVRADDTMCGGCVWEEIVKPLATPLIGWDRGYQPEQAKDPDDRLQPINGGDWIRAFAEAEKHRTEATTDTEKWLRTSDAWDAYCGELIRRLNDADPGNGHGVRRHDHPLS